LFAQWLRVKRLPATRKGADMSDLHRRTHLFTVRLWVEQVARDRTEIRGRVQHVLSGEVGYFRTWPQLANFFEARLAESTASDASSGSSSESNQRS
jgi:hypothetical protein